MLQIIGLIISIYTIVRLVSLGSRTGERCETALVRIMSALGAVAILILAAILLTSGSPPPP